MRPDVKKSPPAPPSWVGAVTPRKPMRASAGIASGGHHSSSSMRCCNGHNSACAKRSLMRKDLLLFRAEPKAVGGDCRAREIRSGSSHAKFLPSSFRRTCRQAPR